MLKLRAYSVKCPCCVNVIDIQPPESKAAEESGLTHRCAWCRRLLLTTIERPGPLGISNVLAIGPSDRFLTLAPVCLPATGRQNMTC